MSAKRETNAPRDHPSPVRFYTVYPQDDGTVDIYLRPDRDSTYYIRGIIPWDGLEEDIRRKYDHWLLIGNKIDI